MLQSIRDNSQGIIAKVIVGLIIVTFALFGVESLVSLTSGSNAPATVNGKEISQQELYQGVQLQRRQMLAQMGDDADPALLDENLISNMVLEGLVDQTILVQSAENQGLSFSDNMIDQLILSTPEFQQDGQFNRAQFEATLRNAGLTPLSYRDLVRKEKLTEQERAAYMLSAFTLPQELKAVAELDGQTRDVRYITLDAEPVRATVTVSDDDIAAYYEQNRSQYMTDEQVTIEYLLLDQADLVSAITVEPSELETAYQVMKDNFTAQEQRHAAHILIEISDIQDDAAAKAKAEAIAERLKAGEAFADLAKEMSDDPASAEMGGDLGVNEKGVFSPEFEEALDALAKGEVSAPVRTEFGYHLIKLVDLIETSVPDFAEAEAGLRADLIKQKAEEEYVGQLERLADISFSSGDLSEPAEALGLKIMKTEPFPRSGNDDEITSNPKVLGVAFDPELIREGLNSTPVELDSGRAVVLRVVEHQLPREKTQDEVADQIRAELVEQKASEELSSQAQALLAQLQSGEKTFADLAADFTVTERPAMTRSDREVAQEVREISFKLPKPEAQPSFAVVDMVDGNKAVLALDAVNTAAVDLEENELRFMGMMLNSRQGQQDYQDHVNQLKAGAEVERL